MIPYAQRQARRRIAPIIGFFVREWQAWRKEQIQPWYGLTLAGSSTSDFLPYPVDMAPLLALPHGRLDAVGVPYNAATTEYPAVYHPTTIAQYALANWNAWLTSHDEQHRQALLTQARWLLEHEIRGAGDTGIWPIPFAASAYPTPNAWISALTQGNIISVFARAFRLTGDEVFLQAARRAVRPFERDILDGGVCAPVGDAGVFFEEVAVYPASRILNGYIFAVLGLYDYVALTDDRQVASLIHDSHATLHGLMSEFDAGFWSRYDQLHHYLATPFYHAVHIALLKALGQLSGCHRCEAVAARWEAHLHRRSSRLRYFVQSRRRRYRGALWRRIRRALLRVPDVDPQAAPDLVCAPVAAFPVAGGTRGVLSGIARAMADDWEIEYLSQHVGPAADAHALAIERFGQSRAVPWRFPNVWLYVVDGWTKLISLLRQHHRYRLILPQDGAFTGAFSAVAAKMAGVRVVCMDHGNVTLPESAAFRAERAQAAMRWPWWQRPLWRLREACYVPTLRLLARVAVRYTDHFLPAGEDVAVTYVERYHVHPSKITRFPFWIDAARFTPPDEATRTQQRKHQAIAVDAIVIVMVNRLAPEKGLDVALQGMSEALRALPGDVRARVRMVIAGDGPLRAQVEADIRRHGLEGQCTLWGEASPDDVGTLLGISDIFLYTGTRGINPVAVLEAMAAGCGVIATTAPELVAGYLAEGRGLAIPPGDASAVATALERAITNLPLCRTMGRRARDYIATYHTATALRRALRRGTFWAADVANLPATALDGAGTRHTWQSEAEYGREAGATAGGHSSPAL